MSVHMTHKTGTVCMSLEGVLVLQRGDLFTVILKGSQHICTYVCMYVCSPPPSPIHWRHCTVWSWNTCGVQVMLMITSAMGNSSNRHPHAEPARATCWFRATFCPIASSQEVTYWCAQSFKAFILLSIQSYISWCRSFSSASVLHLDTDLWFCY